MAKTIELNGKQYDATTGLPIKTIAKKPVAKTMPAQARRSAGVFIDGVRRPIGQAAQSIRRPLAALPNKMTPKKSRTPAKEAQKIHHRTQRTKTLLRRAVKAPASKTPITATSKQINTKATPAVAIDHKREERLNKQVPKSERISRFAKPMQQKVAIPSHVAPATRVSNKPVASVTKSDKSSSAAVAKARQQSVSKKEKLIAEGLAKAQSHNERQPARQKTRRKIWRLAVPITAVVLVLGYLVYQSIPNIAMKVAASKAGFSANLPNYNPDGFSLKGPLAYAAGEITIGYHSNTDDREYKITQKKSNWDSESLLTNFVTSKSDYQTYRDHGLTIYVFDTSNATWVNSGVWYTLEGQSNLSSQQIIKIAASL